MQDPPADRPNYTKRIVCLANSRRPPSGRCVAGIEIAKDAPDGWIRPISSRQTEEVSERERRYQDGTEPRILDIISLPLIEHRPKPPQQENWLLDAHWYWLKVGSFPPAQLNLLVDNSGPLWVNGYSSYECLNNRAPDRYASALDSSLKLIFVDHIKLHVYTSNWEGVLRRRVQAKFSFDGEDYGLHVTDPEIETAYFAQPDGSHELGAAYLTISLSASFNYFCYKLVATIIGATS
jgi:hypothetical protein